MNVGRTQKQVTCLRMDGFGRAAFFSRFTFLLSLFAFIGLTTAPVPAYSMDDPLTDPELARQAIAILQQRCVSCHGEMEQEGDLRLDSAEHLARGGARGPLLAQDLEDQSETASLLIASIDGSHAELSMPPENPLPAAELEKLRQWVKSGGHWPTSSTEDRPALSGSFPEANQHFRFDDVWQRTDHPVRREFADDRWEHWAWRPRSHPSPPLVQNASWAQNPIDQFLLADWESKGLSPAADLDRRKWLRRLSFDLIGLPPTPEEMDEFLRDTSEQAFSKQIERLLDHPGYGQHWARMWLDTVRYSDSNGFDWDEFRPQAWRYRDYVIAAFQTDKPYDQFVREQLAGDEMFEGPPRTFEQQQALIATGYLRMGPHDNAAGLFNEQARSRDELLTDLVETTGSAFLGLTLSCCRCHDHKTDALLQADHYRMRAFFAGVSFADDLPIDLVDDQLAIEQQRAALQAEIESLEKSDSAEAEETKTKVAELKSRLPGFTYAVLMRDQAEIAATHVLAQGDYRKPQQPVEPGFPVMWNPYDSAAATVPRVGSSGRRTALANWIMHPENPLTARVIVNRLWQNYFGRGLVATPNDFGVTGESPSNLALLDWLANELIVANWSLKHVQRLIVSSHAYRQQAVVVGPSGQKQGSLFQQLKRLTAEQLRDAVLMVSGQLLPHAGGPPVWPPLPPEALQANPALLDDNETKTKGWYPSPPEQQPVRSIFLIQKRTVPLPLMETFDLPDNSVSCGCRQQSLVAPQALTLLNGDLMETASEALAGQVATFAERDQQIQDLYRRSLQRGPTTEELEACQLFVDQYGVMQLARVLLNLNEFMLID
jgi:hypothetical protein